MYIEPFLKQHGYQFLRLMMGSVQVTFIQPFYLEVWLLLLLSATMCVAITWKTFTHCRWSTSSWASLIDILICVTPMTRHELFKLVSLLNSLKLLGMAIRKMHPVKFHLSFSLI